MTSATREKAAHLRAEGAVQIIAWSDRGSLALVNGDSGIYQTTVLCRFPRLMIAGEFRREPYAGTCTCQHGVSHAAAMLDNPDRSPIFVLSEGEGCSHFLTLVEEAQAGA